MISYVTIQYSEADEDSLSMDEEALTDAVNENYIEATIIESHLEYTVIKLEYEEYDDLLDSYGLLNRLLLQNGYCNYQITHHGRLVTC